MGRWVPEVINSRSGAYSLVRLASALASEMSTHSIAKASAEVARENLALPGLEVVDGALDAQAPCGASIEAATRSSIRFVSAVSERASGGEVGRDMTCNARRFQNAVTSLRRGTAGDPRAFCLELSRRRRRFTARMALQKPCEVRRPRGSDGSL